MIAAIAFYVLSAVSVIAALRVVLASNPVHSVLWLITSFFSAAGLFVLMGAEFLAMLLVVVYVGAVLYTDYVYFFQAAGLVLLVAMIGAIVLTLRHKGHVKRQVIMDQVARTPKTPMVNSKLATTR